jgi:integrase
LAFKRGKRGGVDGSRWPGSSGGMQSRDGVTNDMDLVFSNAKDKPLCADNIVKRQFLPALRRAKIRDIRFHDLRHTNVALRIEQGQNIFYISK